MQKDNQLLAVFRALRPHQWSKNLLLIVPAVAAQIWMEPDVVLELVLACVAFSLTASGGYILNDLIDFDADRRHPEKQSRPFASGQLSLSWGFVMGPVLLFSGIAVAYSVVNIQFGTVVVTYALLSAAYSRWIKRRLLLDVMLLAGFYALRLVAGGAAVSVEVSSWLLAFSMFFFLSLAFAKRLMEFDLSAQEHLSSSSARPYTSVDRDAFRTIGPTCGLLSILVLALYISSDTVQAIYGRPQALWLVCPLLLYWILRIWFIALRGDLHHDPVVFALRDRVSYAVAGAILVVLYLASR
ncbi:MAG: UbiA family prenyltransferase [Gammaproteobacteria bacterium]|nr:UbiA family prenyltransferase [Gammaproteobacteria bacterium]